MSRSELPSNADAIHARNDDQVRSHTPCVCHSDTPSASPVWAKLHTLSSAARRHLPVIKRRDHGNDIDLNVLRAAVDCVLQITRLEILRA